MLPSLTLRVGMWHFVLAITDFVPHWLSQSIILNGVATYLWPGVLVRHQSRFSAE